MGFCTPELAHGHTQLKWLAHQSCRRLMTILFINLGMLGGTSVALLCSALGVAPELVGLAFAAVSATLAPYGAILARRENLQRRVFGRYGREEMKVELYLRDCEVICATVPDIAMREAFIARRCEEYLDETRVYRSRLAA